MKERMAKTIQDAIKDCDEHQPFRKVFLQIPQTIYFRVDDDTCSISLDTTGDALFKRGIKKLSVDAPLRETFASALARFIQRSGLLKGPVEVMDPVCGSGTLLYAFDELPFPIRGRPMAYENFPCTAQLLEKSKLTRTPVPWSVESLLGSDISEKALAAAKKNLEAWKLAGGANFDVRKKDLIEVTTPKEPRKDLQRVVLMNPPYGQRISGYSVSVLLTRALEIFEPDVLGLVCPIGEAPKKLPEPYRWFQKPLAVSNGGIDVELRLARRSGRAE
jgi:putative N6-adenine-specific DNA methylase